MAFVGISFTNNDIVEIALIGFLYIFYFASCFLGVMAIIAIQPKYFEKLNDKSKESIIQSFGTWLKIRNDGWSLFNIFDIVTYVCIIVWSLVLEFHLLTFLLFLNRGVFESIFISEAEKFKNNVYQPIILEYYKRQIQITQKYMEHIFKSKEQSEVQNDDRPDHKE